MWMRPSASPFPCRSERASLKVQGNHPMRRLPSLPLAALFLAALPSSSPAGPTPIPVAVPTRNEPVSYAKDIADILAAKCVGCHSDALAENKLNIEEVAGMLK